LILGFGSGFGDFQNKVQNKVTTTFGGFETFERIAAIITYGHAMPQF
jgi:hypothetical protein